MNNKIQIIIVLLLITINQTPLAYSSSYDETLENVMGNLVLLHDKKHSYQTDLNSFGSAEVYKKFIEIYNQKIKSLPIDYRINYFWTGMWHLSFDGHYMSEFQQLIMHDCGKKFINRLQEYVNKEKKLNRYKSRLYLSEKVLEGLKMIHDRK
jgi:hypothetical protein